ncbi:MAG: FKBP-type peptidyl-prolyl cis-trans isomerase [Bacteroidetes bacterium]|nr:FKBP-type peptidyl-prolyl cis-trans isomerase [Bacteroidota bacterium]
MKIGTNSIAGISYTLTSNISGEVLEKTPDNNLMKFKFGVGELLPKFEQNLLELAGGESFDFIIPAGDAYGSIDPYAVFDIPKDTFEVDGKIDNDMLQIGNQIPLTDNEGNKHIGLITKLMDNAVTMNFNHPLAGVDLRFVGKVIEVFE